MNAGGMAKACKSNENPAMGDSGGRARNTFLTCPEVEDRHGKLCVILHVLERGKPQGASGAGNVLSGSWRGKGPPSLRRVAGVRA